MYKKILITLTSNLFYEIFKRKLIHFHYYYFSSQKMYPGSWNSWFKLHYGKNPQQFFFSLHDTCFLHTDRFYSLSPQELSPKEVNNFLPFFFFLSFSGRKFCGCFLCVFTVREHTHIQLSIFSCYCVAAFFLYQASLLFSPKKIDVGHTCRWRKKRKKNPLVGFPLERKNPRKKFSFLAINLKVLQKVLEEKLGKVVE